MLKLFKILKISLPFLALAIGIAMRLFFLEIDPVRQSPDEKIYKIYAEEVASQGILAFPTLLDSYRADPKFWIYPPPTRLGYVAPIAMVKKLFGSKDFAAIVYWSRFMSILTLILLCVMGLRYFGKTATSVALIFLSVSPLDLAISNRAWPDSQFAFLCAILLFSTIAIMEKQNLFRFFIFGATGVAAMLTKELGAVLFFLYVCWLTTYFFSHKDFKKKAAPLFITGLLAMLLTGVCLKFCGSLVDVIDTLQKVGLAISRNAYAADTQSGSWIDFLKGFWLVSPISTALALLGAGVLIFSKTRAHLKGMVFILSGVFLFLSVVPYSINLRYLSAIYVLYFLMAGEGARFIKKKLSIGIVIIFVSVGLVLDYQNSNVLLRQIGILDPITQHLKEYSLYSR